MTSKGMPNAIMERKSVPKTKVCKDLDTRTYVLAYQSWTDSKVLEHLRLGTAKVRDVLGPELPITDKEIEDSLWHYYYDIDKTVNYLLSMTQQTVIPVA